MPGASARLTPRSLFALNAGKVLGTASRQFGRGGGTALPGAVADRLDSQLTARLACQLGAGCLLVTGTNGKTTTARMLAGIFTAAGLEPVHNRSGSNLMRGIETALLQATNATGTIARGGRRAGVFEVDEATLPAAVGALQPRGVVFTNLFRDQLDRYGEVDSILALWRQSLRALPSGATIVLNADDPSVAGLASSYAGPIRTYGIDDAKLGAPPEHAADARWCATCGTEFAYRSTYYGHLGLWHCPGCGRSRPEPHVLATSVVAAAETSGLRLTVAVDDAGAHDLVVPLSGVYNAYNAVAALAASQLFGVSIAVAAGALATVPAAFGRQERVPVRGRDVQLLLCKNPAGTNQALASVLADPAPLHLLVALNDGIQDGRDVSWIWDVDFERLAGRVDRVTTTGTRASDAALRLKYAGLGDHIEVVTPPDRALDAALTATPIGQRLYVLPTYTAMMTLRARTAALGGRLTFWEQ